MKDKIAWEVFIQQSETKFRKIDDITYKELKKIKRIISHNVTMPEARAMIVNISKEFNLSPKTSFKLWQNKCEV